MGASKHALRTTVEARYDDFKWKLARKNNFKSHHLGSRFETQGQRTANGSADSSSDGKGS